MDPLTEAADLVYAAPASSFIRGTKKSVQLRGALEKLFGYQAQVDTSIRKKLKKGRPTKLRHDGLDGEQIWSLMQLWDSPLITWAEGMANTLEDAGVHIHLLPDAENGADEDGEGDDDSGDDDLDEDEGLDHDGEGEDDEEEEEGEDFDGMEEDGDENDAVRDTSAKEDDVDSELDDDIFRIAEMDAFAEKMENQLQKEWDKEREMQEKGKTEDDDDDEDMDSYDSEQDESDSEFVKRALYGNLDEEDAESDDDDEEEEVNVKYDEFFDPPASEKGEAASRSVQRLTQNSEKQAISKRDRAKAELAEKIAELEAEAISEKPWNLKGEAKATMRPKDSLLEEKDLDVDFLKRTTPALTPEIAAQIEDVVLKRYMDGKFDDCEVKSDAEREALPFTAVLSKEKSKEGLAETYAKDYAEKVLNQTPQEKVEIEKERAEIRDMFERLCQKLDSLSSLNYTPKPPPTVNDANRPPDVAAVHMEEVVPTTETGDVSQTAPEEIARKAKGLGKSRKEMEPEERRAARRHAKEVNKKRRIAKGEVILPTKRPKTQVKTADEASAPVGSDATKWTSSAQVFRRMEQTRRDASNGV